MNNVTIPEGCMVDKKGRFWPEDTVPGADKLKDQTVNKIAEYAENLSAEIARFKAHTFADLSTTVEILAEQYGTHVGGVKGNITFHSFDGLKKVEIKVQDFLEFGPELQIAKGLIDECITDWAVGSNSEIRALVNHAFNVEKPGKVNREALFSLRRIQISDPRWQNAIKAINDSIQVIGSKPYVRIYKRDTVDEKFQPISLDVAAL